MGLYCTLELYLFHPVDGGRRVASNLLNRLMTIYLEDVGISHPGMLARVDDLLQHIMTFREKRLAGKLPVEEAAREEPA